MKSKKRLLINKKSLSYERNLSRLKRDAKEDEDFARKKEECKDLARNSIERGGKAAITTSASSAANSAAQGVSAAGKALGWFGDAAVSGISAGGHAVAVGGHTATAVLHGEKLQTDLAMHDKGCSGIPFTEVKQQMKKGFEETGKSLDRNLNAIENNSKSIDRNLNAINNVGDKVDRNYRGIENNLKAINRNGEAIDRNYGAINKNHEAIKENYNAIKQNYDEIKQVSGKVDRNFGAIERNFDQLKINEGEIKLVGGKVDRNYGAIQQVSAQVDRNLGAIERNFDQLKVNEGQIRIVGGKVDRNYGAILQVSDKVDRNFDAIERNFEQLKINEGEIKIVGGKVDRNYGAIQEVSARVDRNLAAIEHNFEQLRVNEGEIKIVGGKVDRNHDAIKQVYAQVDKNFDAIKVNLGAIIANSIALKENRDEIKQVSEKVDRNLGTLVENYHVTKQTLEAADRNYLAINRIEDKLDRSFSVMLSGFRYIVDKIDEAKNEMMTRIEKLNEFIETSRIESAISQIVAFFEVVSIELDGVENLSHERAIEKLEAKDGTLYLLKSVRNPTKGNLYHDLKSIIRQEFAIPKNSDDKMAFLVLDLLYSGTQLYTSVMYSLVRSYLYLSSHYYARNDIEKYNSYLSELEITSKAFVDSLIGIGKNVGLVGQVNGVYDRVEELDFIKEENQQLLESLTIRRDKLNAITSGCEKLIKYLPGPAPVFKIDFDFSRSNITTPFGNWRDGNEVSYAIHIDKGDGNYTKVSDWVSYQIQSHANPVLNIGTVSTGETRSIFRKFNDNKPELVSTIADNSQTEIRDISRDFLNAVLKRNERVALNEMDLLIKDGADINVEYGERGYIMNAAASIGNLNIVSTLIENGADINARDVDGNAPIYIATQHGYKRIVEFLIEKGADVSAMNDLNSTPLHVAAQKGDVDIFKLLIKNGAQLNATASSGYTPLHSAAEHGSNSIVDMIAKQNDIDINAISDQGLTPLHLASMSGQDLVVQSLLRDNRTNINSKNKKGLTSLHLASTSGKLSVVKLLAAQSDKLEANIRSADELTPLHLAIFFKREDVAAELLKLKDIEPNSRTREGMTPLHIAAMQDQLGVLRRLLRDKKVSPEERDLNDQTPLHIAAEQGNLQVVEALVEEANAGLNVRRKDGRTPLHLATLNRRSDIVSYLIRKNARLYTKDSTGNTALLYAINTGKSELVKILVEAYRKKNYKINEALHSAAYNGNLGIVKHLMELKVQDVNSRDKIGCTPIHYAALQNNFNIVNFLGDSGADLSAKDNRANTIMHLAAQGADADMIQYLARKGIHTNTTNNANAIPLHYASLSANFRSMKYLTEETSADINQQDTDGNTVMHYLGVSGKKDPYAKMIKYMEKVGAKIDEPNLEGHRPLLEFAHQGSWEDVEFLISKGVSTSMANSSGETALHYAARDGNINIVKLILKASPDIVNSRDQNGSSALFWALRYGHLEIVKLLIDEKRAKYNAPASRGLSALHMAILSGNLEIVRYLVEEKLVSTNISDAESDSPLHLAAHYGYLEIVNYLIKNRAAKNALDKNNSTPLLKAASNKNWDVVKSLIENAANAKISDKDKNNLVHKCAEGGALEILTSLSGFDMNMRNSRGETPLYLAVKNGHSHIVEYLVADKGVNLEARDGQGNTPLHLAAQIGNLDTVKYLTGKGSDPTLTNEEGKTPCDLCKDSSIARYFIEEKNIGHTFDAFKVAANGGLGILKYLVEEQLGNADMVDGGGKSLIHYAAEKGMTETVKYLEGTKKIDINKKDELAKTPMQYALLNGHFDVADYLYEMNDEPHYNDFELNFTNDDDMKIIQHILEKELAYIDVKGDVSDRFINLKDGTGKTLLHHAARLGNLDMVKLLVELGASINNKDSNGATPLDMAKDQPTILAFLIDKEKISNVFSVVKNGNLALLKNLIEFKKIDINSVDKDNKTLLDYANDYVHPKIIKYLIDERGVKYDGNIFTAVEKGQIGMLKYFFEEKELNVNSRDTLGWTPLMKASYNGHLQLAKYLVDEKQADINMRNNNEFTALHAATEKGHLELVRYMCEKGADANAKDSGGRTPLEYAIIHEHPKVIEYLKNEKRTPLEVDLITAATKGQLSLVKYLIEEQKKPIESIDTNGLTALLAASLHGHLSIVKYLVEQGAKIDAQDKKNNTPLYYAIDNDREDVVEYLSDKGATSFNNDLITAASHGHLNTVKYLREKKQVSMDLISAEGATALHCAAREGHLSVVRYLVEQGARINAKDKKDRTPLYYALDNDRKDIVEYLSDKGATSFDNDSIIAASSGHLSTVKYLIEVKHDSIEAVTSEGSTALHWAARNGHLEVVIYLVGQGVRINVEDKRDKTALCYALEYDRQEVVKYLDEKGATSFGNDLINAASHGHLSTVKYLRELKHNSMEGATSEGSTALHWSARNGHMSVVRYLVEQGARINAKDKKDRTPLYYALDNDRKDVVEYLSDKGATSFNNDLITAASYGHLNTVKYLREVKHDSMEGATSEGLTTLHWAARNGHLEVVKYLVGQGARMNAKDKTDYTPLYYAISNKHEEVAKYLKDNGGISFSGDIFSAAENGQLEAVKYFIEKTDQNVNSKDALGWTPLIRAAYNGRLQVVEYLVNEKQADVNMRNKYDFTALHAAAEKGHLEVLKYLIDKGSDIGAKDNAHKSPLDYAIDFGHSQLIEYLGRKHYERGVKDIFMAAERGQRDMVRYFGEGQNRAVDYNDLTNEHGANVLHIAAWKSQLNLVRYLVEEKKMTVNRRDHRGRTPLHEAAGSLSLDMVKYLIEKGAHFGATANDGRTTPLYSALMSGKGKSPVTDYLCTFYSSCKLSCETNNFSTSCSYSTSSYGRPVRSVVASSDDIFSKGIPENESSQIISESSQEVNITRPIDVLAHRQLVTSIVENATKRASTGSDGETFSSKETALEARGYDINGTLLALTILNKLPIVGKFLPQIKPTNTNKPEPEAIPLAESMAYATEITKAFEDLLLAVQPKSSVEMPDINPLALASEVARLFREGGRSSGLSKLLYSYAEKVSMKDDALLASIRLKLPELEKLYDSKFARSVKALDPFRSDGSQINPSLGRHTPESSLRNITTRAVTNRITSR